MSDPVVSVHDPRVLQVPICDNGEALVDVRDYGIVVIDTDPRVSNTTSSRFTCRSSVAERLVVADRSIGADLRLAVAEAHRPLSLQRLFWETNLERIRSTDPTLKQTELENETAKFVAPPGNTPPHSTGGAVDVVVLAGNGELDMGSGLNERCPQMATHYDGLDRAAQQNRSILVAAMTNAGLVNYGHEWWHYSYGDRYWAFMTGADAALFGGR